MNEGPPPERSRSAVPDRWLVLELPRPGDADTAALVVEELLALPARGVEERDDALVVYLPPPEGGDLAPLLGRLDERLTPLLGRAPEPTVRWQPQEAWEQRWRRGLGPRRLTPRIVVSPSWCDPGIRSGELLVTVDPGMAFGTAEHATTRASIRLLDRLVAPGARVADVGAGSGILSIVAARLGATEVLAVEVDPWACEAARENVERNAVADRVRLLEAGVTARFLPGEPPFDGIVANIETGILRPLLPGFRARLRPGGWLVLSGILETEAESMRTAARAAGFDLHAQEPEGEWWSAAFVSEAHAVPKADAGGGEDPPAR